MASYERPTKTLQRRWTGFTGQHPVVQVYQSLSVRVRVLTGNGKLQFWRQIKRWQVHPGQVQQRFGLLQNLGGVALVGRLLEARFQPLQDQTVARPAGGAVRGADPAGPALDQQHRQREEQVEVLEAGVRQGGLVVLGHAVARHQAVSQ